MNELESFQQLAELFEHNGHKLYLVGGAVRDFLLYKNLTDLDLVTDSTPEETMNFFPDGDYTFSHFGCVKIRFNNLSFDLTTLREEKYYSDYRHPNNIEYVKELSRDYKRRDFTINALYLDKNLKIIDYTNGQEDLKNKILRTIGDADIRIKEDPLRIIRAIRFSLTYNLKIDEDLEKAIFSNISLLNKININKIEQDIKKIKNIDKDNIKNIFEHFGILRFLSMIK